MRDEKIYDIGYGLMVRESGEIMVEMLATCYFVHKGLGGEEAWEAACKDIHDFATHGSGASLPQGNEVPKASNFGNQADDCQDSARVIEAFARRIVAICSGADQT